MTAIISSPLDFNLADLYVDLGRIVGRRLYVKCEGFNFAGSIKLKAAVEMVEEQERQNRIRPGATLVESSSGNMGVARALVAKSRGYRFVCVTDPRCTVAAQRLMTALGARVQVVTDTDEQGGFLGTRLAFVRQLCRANPTYVWLNQYDNASNWTAHYRTTGPEVSKAFPNLDVLFIGAGTTGTLMGCARYFRENHPAVRIVAVDTVGSVTFGSPPGERLIPGLGTSVRPAILDESYVDEVVHVAETDTIRMCHRVAGHGFLFGGSTGTAICGAHTWLERHDPAANLIAVTISADLGHNYLDTVYNDTWLTDAFGARL